MLSRKMTKKELRKGEKMHPQPHHSNNKRQILKNPSNSLKLLSPSTKKKGTKSQNLRTNLNVPIKSLRNQEQSRQLICIRIAGRQNRIKEVHQNQTRTVSQ